MGASKGHTRTLERKVIKGDTRGDTRKELRR